MLSEVESGQPNRAWPSKKEINALLDQHKGAAQSIKIFSKKYGPPKGSWGPWFRQVMRERKAISNASIKTSVNATTDAPANAQPNAHGTVAPLNSASETTNVAEHSTPNVPMVNLREPDAIINPQEQATYTPVWDRRD